MGVKKIPKVKDLNEEYARLLSDKKTAYAEYRKLRDEAQDWLSLRTISKAFLRLSVQKYSINKVSAKKPPNRYKARKQSFPAENHRRNSLTEIF